MTVIYLCCQPCKSLIFLSFHGNLKNNFLNDKQTRSMSFRSAKEDLVPFSLCHSHVRYSLVIAHSFCKRCSSVGIHQGHGCTVSQDVMTYLGNSKLHSPMYCKEESLNFMFGCHTPLSYYSFYEN